MKKMANGKNRKFRNTFKVISKLFINGEQYGKDRDIPNCKYYEVPILLDGSNTYSTMVFERNDISDGEYIRYDLVKIRL